MYQLISSIIKYFCIIFCSHYIFTSILNVKNSVYKTIATMILSFALPFGIYYLRIKNSSYILGTVVIVLMVLISFAFNLILYKKSSYITFVSTTIAYGISLCIFVLPTLIVTPITYAVYNNSKEINDAYLFTFLLVGALQIIFVFLIFQIKRFKSGWKFLEQYGKSDIGFIISITVLLSYSLFSESAESSSKIYLIPVFFILVSGIIIYIWSKNKITDNYISKLRESDLKAFDSALDEKNAYIKRLEENNDALAKIIHRDNKIIPALTLAVKDYISGNNANQQELLEYIERISNERKGIITEYEASESTIAKSDIISIDAVLKYMYEKAVSKGIDFNVTIQSDLKQVIGSQISEQDFETLLADLIENAIIATNKADKKNILVNFSESDSIFSLDIFDSGIAFEIDTLKNIGTKQITTHKDEGGSGIGMISTFEIADSHLASVIIEEFDFENTPFTKRVSIRFDNKNKHLFISKRAKNLSDIIGRFEIK